MRLLGSIRIVHEIALPPHGNMRALRIDMLLATGVHRLGEGRRRGWISPVVCGGGVRTIIETEIQMEPAVIVIVVVIVVPVARFHLGRMLNGRNRLCWKMMK